MFKTHMSELVRMLGEDNPRLAETVLHALAELVANDADALPKER
jgi:hypothetical protein